MSDFDTLQDKKIFVLSQFERVKLKIVTGLTLMLLLLLAGTRFRHFDSSQQGSGHISEVATSQSGM